MHPCLTSPSPASPDLAVQVHVARGSWLEVVGAEVMFLNRECRYPDLSNLFVRADCSAHVEALLPAIKREIRAQRKMLAGSLPGVGPKPGPARNTASATVAAT
jgi:hypothetical protein